MIIEYAEQPAAYTLVSGWSSPGGRVAQNWKSGCTPTDISSPPEKRCWWCLFYLNIWTKSDLKDILDMVANKHLGVPRACLPVEQWAKQTSLKMIRSDISLVAQVVLNIAQPISCAKYWSTNIAITASVMMKSNLHDIPHVFGGDFAGGEFTPGVRGKSCLVIILI